VTTRGVGRPVCLVDATGSFLILVQTRESAGADTSTLSGWATIQFFRTD
jgi:hypothetical protein